MTRSNGNGEAAGAPVPAADSPGSAAAAQPRPAAAFLPWHRLPGDIVPLQIVPGRFWLWALALSVISGLTIVGSPANGYIDFPQFWAAGSTAGSPDLLDPARHQAWQIAHGLGPGFFAYPPGTAWLFAPFSLVPLAVAFWIHAAIVVALVAASGALAAHIYGFDRRVGLVAAFAWAPCLASAALGQNAVLALLLALLCIEGLRRDDDLLAGVAAGLLLYKPTLAAPLLGLLLLRRRWPGLAAAAVVAAGWYLAGVAATAGDWGWPGHWLSGLSDYYTVDTPHNVGMALSIPGVLAGHGLAALPAMAIGAAIVLAAIPRLLKAPLPEAAAGALLIGLVASPHSLNYEAALMLPFILWAASGRGLAEPARTRLISVAYLVAPTYFVTTSLGGSLVAVILVIASVIWLSGWKLHGSAGPLGLNAGA